MPLRYGLIVGVALWLAAATANAEVSELKITKQPGLLFAPEGTCAVSPAEACGREKTEIAVIGGSSVMTRCVQRDR